MPNATLFSAIVASKVTLPSPSILTLPDRSVPNDKVIACAHFEAVEAFPDSVAVIVPAAKSPLASLKTILSAVLVAVASLTCDEVMLISTFSTCVIRPCLFTVNRATESASPYCFV